MQIITNVIIAKTMVVRKIIRKNVIIHETPFFTIIYQLVKNNNTIFHKKLASVKEFLISQFGYYPKASKIYALVFDFQVYPAVFPKP